MAFLTKKIVSAWLLPLPIAIALLFIGLCFLWFSHKRKFALFFISIGFFILALFTFSFLPNTLIQSLEANYRPLMMLPKNVHKIVVLGGGVRVDTKLPPNTQLSTTSLSRLIEGIRIYQMYKKKHQEMQLILSGGRVFGQPAEAGVMQNIAVILDVNPKNITLEAGSRDTAEEAKYLHKQLSDKRFILVTSAYHMPRAIALFRKLGMHPIAAPTQYMSSRSKSQHTFGYYVPDSGNLVKSDIAIHEYLGKIWSQLHGQI